MDNQHHIQPTSNTNTNPINPITNNPNEILNHHENDQLIMLLLNQSNNNHLLKTNSNINHLLKTNSNILFNNNNNNNNNNHQFFQSQSTPILSSPTHSVILTPLSTWTSASTSSSSSSSTSSTTTTPSFDHIQAQKHHNHQNHNHHHHHRHQQQQQHHHHLELLSPITSPALRPQPCNEPIAAADQLSQLQAFPQSLIDQAASLGLAHHQNFIHNESIDHHHQSLNNHQFQSPQFPISPIYNVVSPLNSQNLSDTTSPISQAVSLPDHHHISPALVPTPSISQPCGINQHIGSSNSSSSSSSHNDGQYPSRKTSLNRHHRLSRSRGGTRTSPQTRPLDHQDLEDETSSPPKRTKGSNSEPSSLVHQVFQSSPSPLGIGGPVEKAPEECSIDLLGIDLSTQKSSAPEPVPLSQPSDPSASSNPIQSAPTLPLQRIRPLTPAGIMNFAQFEIPEPMDNYALRQLIGNSSLIPEDPGSASNLMNPNFNSEISGTEDSARNCDEIKDWINLSSDSNQPIQETPPVKDKEGSGQSSKSATNQTTKAKPISLLKSKTRSTPKTVTIEETPEVKKSWHKVAEQRRRDSLKMCFEELRRILPPIRWEPEQEGDEDEEGEEDEAMEEEETDKGVGGSKARKKEASGSASTKRKKRERRPGEGNVGGQRNTLKYDPDRPNKGISKVTLLRKSNEFIMSLNEKLKLRDRAIEMINEILLEKEGSEKGGDGKEDDESFCGYVVGDKNSSGGNKVEKDGNVKIEELKLILKEIREEDSEEK